MPSPTAKPKRTLFRCFYEATFLHPAQSEVYEELDLHKDTRAHDIDAVGLSAISSFSKSAFAADKDYILTKIQLTRIVSLDGEPQVKVYLSPEEAAVIRMCRSCGCVDADCEQCINRIGEPCTWVADDLCSACEP